MAVKPERQRGLDLEPGTALGKYEILRKLAIGGMAEIYLSRVRGNAGFEKLVVLKRILPHIAQDPTFVNMFLDEARLAATLQHPNIADVYDVGEYDDGEVFFTMEYVHGQDVRGIRWASRKRDEQIPLAMSLAIIHGTASALDYAHDKRGPDGQPLGLVHRDISSSNIMISYDGAVKLLDFGIARATNQSQKTQTGTLKGKIPYMSPEQCRSSRLDRRSDLFSLGTVMFEITTGRRPFRGQGDFDIMEQIVHHEAPRPSTIVNGYPLELEAIVMKLLAREREDRYQNAEEMLHDLDAFLAQNKLWASTKVVGKYMRSLFAERLAALETAGPDGIPESLTPLTGGSARSGLRTPSSAFSAVRLSEERLAMPTDEELEQLDAVDACASAGDATVAMPNVTFPQLAQRPASRAGSVVEPPVEPSVVSVSMPTLRPNRRGLWIAGGGVAVGAIGIMLVLLLSSGKSAPAAVETEPHVDKQAAKQPVEKPVVEKPVVEKPVVEKPVDPVALVKPDKPEVTKVVVKPTGKPGRPVAVKPTVKPKPDKPADPVIDPSSPFLPEQ